MAIVAAPARQFKTYSMWLAIGLVVLNSGILLARSLADIHVVDVETLAFVDSIIGMLIGIAKLIQQNIALTTDEKIDVIEAAAATPVKDGHPDVTVSLTTPPAEEILPLHFDPNH